MAGAKKQEYMERESKKLKPKVEKKVARSASETAPLKKQGIDKLLHELQIHKVELELQNEELRRTQAELEVARERYVDLYDTAPVGYFSLSEKGIILEANLTGANMMGVLPRDLRAGRFSKLIYKADRDTYYLHRQQLFDTRAPQLCEMRMVRRDGSLFWAQVEAAMAQDAISGKPVCRATMSDITERRQAEEDTRIREAHLQSLVNILQYDTVSIQDFLDKALDEAIKLTESKIGYIYYYDEEKKEFTLNTWSKGVMQECTIAEKKAKYQLEKTGIWGEAVRQRKPIVMNDFQAPHALKKGYPQGHAKLFRYLTVPVLRENRIMAVVAVANKESDYTQTDILQLTLLMDSVWKATYSKYNEFLARERTKELQAIYGLAELNTREGITLDNLYREFTSILPGSWQHPEIACARIVIDSSEFRSDNFADSTWTLSSPVKVHGTAVGRIEVGYLENRPELDEGPFLKEERMLLDALAERIGYITERRRMENMLKEMATHDFLTGLPNRVLLTDRFNMAASLAHRNKVRLAVMSLDLDKFKTINDTLGHDAGDQVLKTVSARLTGIIRASDTVARIGGDEFILVMMESNRAKDATAIAQKILDAFVEPLSIDGHRLHLSTSIGIAIYPEDSEDMETLIKKSDAALYYSKGHGRNRFKFYSDGDVRMGGDHKSAKC